MSLHLTKKKCNLQFQAPPRQYTIPTVQHALSTLRDFRRSVVFLCTTMNSRFVLFLNTSCSKNKKTKISRKRVPLPSSGPRSAIPYNLMDSERAFCGLSFFRFFLFAYEASERERDRQILRCPVGSLISCRWRAAASF